MIVIGSHEEFEKHLGKSLGESEYFQITQEQINKFADATLDQQWIHTDPAKAATDSPFESTIAHGYLTLSIAPYLWKQIAEIKNLKMMINYGIENLRFNQPVLVNDKVRLSASLFELTNLRGISRCKLKVKLEIEGNKKPAFTGILVFLYHFITPE